MDKPQLLAYLEKLDEALRQPTTLYVYGSAACILLDQPDRTSLDIDVAGPYSQADSADLRRAADVAGLPVDPDENYAGDHIEWVSALRLCLPKPQAGTELRLWQGSRLTLKTASIPHLIASKLVRYDELDRSDIRYLYSRVRPSFAEIEAAVAALPPQFAQDALVIENLGNLRSDIRMWAAQS